jgi:hypothetical protein
LAQKILPKSAGEIDHSLPLKDEEKGFLKGKWRKKGKQ